MIIMVDNKKIEISNEIVAAIHHQENIDFGRSILENYYPEIIDDISDEECAAYAVSLEDKMLSDNGALEYEIATAMFGKQFDENDEPVTKRNTQASDT